ncbi:hypothetical protein AAG565_14165 [Fontimonas sp. SYSU GA230001]|uniref:hypothetical protein n=1 Tax=Fontimonas sp. SYSU GA230001 TaxID=3142450 RepID=UPI0032B3BDAE
MKVLPILLFLAYPALVHAGVVLDAPGLALAGLLVLVAVVLYKPLAAPRPWAWALLVLGGALLYALAHSDAVRYAVYAPSLAIPAALAALFGASLRDGREPLISRIARIERGGMLAPDLAVYTRQLTQLWTAAFVLMFVLALALIALGEIQWWSLLTNVLNYVAIGLLFALEYGYRRWRFPQHPHRGFLDHIRTVARHRRTTG